MNQFVNNQTRSIELPESCKDLIDVLQLTNRNQWPDYVQLPLQEGMADIENYLLRLLESKAASSILRIFSIDPQVWLAVAHQYSEGTLPVTQLTLFVDNADNQREQLVGRIFGERHLLPIRVKVTNFNGVTASRLTYPLPAAAPAATQLITDLLRQVYGLAADATLQFHFSEKFTSLSCLKGA